MLYNYPIFGIYFKVNFFNPYSGLERTFSAFGLIHSKLRNRLSNERVMKLVRVYCHLRDTEGTDLDNFLQVQMAEDIQE